MIKYLFTSLAALSIGMAFGQNYVDGPLGIAGPQYNPATTISSNGSVQVSTSGVWTMDGSVTSTPRSTANGVTFINGGTYAQFSATNNFIDGFVSEVGNTAFTFPTGDGTAASGNQFHPLAVSAPSTSATVTVSYKAAATPNTAAANLVVDNVDMSAYYTMSSSVSTTATATASVRDETGVFVTGSTLLVAGYNTSATTWQDLRSTTSRTTAAQNLTSATMDLSAYTYLTVGVAQPLTVTPYVLLQGPSNTATPTIMSVALQTQISNLPALVLAQPYTAAPFGIGAAGYAGTESIASVASIPATMTDWVLVELRDPTTPATVVAARAAIIMNDGTITDIDGVSPVSFPGVTAGNFFVAIRHRNHLGVRSSATLALNGKTVTTWDFRSSQSKAYQNTTGTVTNDAMAVLANGSFAMFGGNSVNTDGIIKSSGLAASNDCSKTLAYSNITTTKDRYSLFDENMDGLIKSSGLAASNDYSKSLAIVAAGTASASNNSGSRASIKEHL